MSDGSPLDHRQVRSLAIHEAIQFRIGNCSCHASVALRQIGVVVIAAQDGFERSIPPDESGQAFASSTARQNAGTHLGLTNIACSRLA